MKAALAAAAGGKNRALLPWVGSQGAASEGQGAGRAAGGLLDGLHRLTALRKDLTPKNDANRTGSGRFASPLEGLEEEKSEIRTFHVGNRYINVNILHKSTARFAALTEKRLKTHETAEDDDANSGGQHEFASLFACWDFCSERAVFPPEKNTLTARASPHGFHNPNMVRQIPLPEPVRKIFSSAAAAASFPSPPKAVRPSCLS